MDISQIMSNHPLTNKYQQVIIILQGSSLHSFEKAGKWFSNSKFVSPKTLRKIETIDECMVQSKIKILSEKGEFFVPNCLSKV